jgi:actin-related protein 6
MILLAPRLCLYNDIPALYGQRQAPAPDCVVIIDVGYSFTHIVPFINGIPVSSAIRRCVKEEWRLIVQRLASQLTKIIRYRINIGGKLLTNQLKELVSFR